MALSSMTGFARSHGASGPYTFEWELKSVNAKGFDLRLRLPPGWDDAAEGGRGPAIARRLVERKRHAAASNGGEEPIAPLVTASVERERPLTVATEADCALIKVSGTSDDIAVAPSHRPLLVAIVP